MKSVIIRLIKGVYIAFVIMRYLFRKNIVNINYANKLFLSIDHRAIIPLLKFCKAEIGQGCIVEGPIRFHMANGNLANLKIGKYTCISTNCFFDLADRITIGNNCTLAMEVMITTHMHVGYSSFGKEYKNSIGNVKIGNNVYIGARTTIMKDIMIEDNCIIGAASLVNKDVPTLSVAAGVPLKSIKSVNI